MFLGGRDRIRAPGALSYKPAKLQVGAGNRLSWPSSNAGIRVFPIAAIFSQENSIQNFPSLSASRLLFILTVCCYCLHRETSGSCCTHRRGFQCFPLASGAAGRAKRWLFILILLAVCNGNSQSFCNETSSPCFKSDPLFLPLNREQTPGCHIPERARWERRI